MLKIVCMSTVLVLLLFQTTQVMAQPTMKELTQAAKDDADAQFDVANYEHVASRPRCWVWGFNPETVQSYVVATMKIDEGTTLFANAIIDEALGKYADAIDKFLSSATKYGQSAGISQSIYPEPPPPPEMPPVI